jgi:hypothetical protein
MAKNLCAIRENPAQLSGALGVLLEPLKKTAVLSSHHAACPVEEIPRLFHEISQYVSTSARACEFAILTCCRSRTPDQMIPNGEPSGEDQQKATRATLVAFCLWLSESRHWQFCAYRPSGSAVSPSDNPLS